MRPIDAQQIRNQRTAEEKQRRHLQGDVGAKYSQGKYQYVADDGIMGALTTQIQKDNILAIIYET